MMMKVAALFLCIIMFIVSCRNETAPETATEMDTVENLTKNYKAEVTVPYTVEYDNKAQALTLVQNDADIENTTVADIITALNQKHRDIKLDLINTGKDTITVKIDDANKLTQEMGSAGAEAYLAEITFSLTEMPGIKAVKIDFEEGDHAIPGVYTRADFKELINSGDKK